MKQRKSPRLNEYDYSNPGWYYVTICTKNMICHFGEVKSGEIILNQTGEIASNYWKEIEMLHKHIELDNFIIMPNHIHGIIIINENVNVGDAKFASTTDRTKMELSKIIQQYKRAVTINIKSTFPNSTFKWQRSFYDRIIRNERELYNIRKYIAQNPLKWDLEKGNENLEL